MALWARSSCASLISSRGTGVVTAHQARRNALNIASSSFCKRTLSSVVYADRGVVVVNKPPGLVCQLNHQGKNGSIDPNGELEDFLSDIQRELKLKTTPIPVHRLDKSTTGALFFALNPQLARDLSKQFKERTIEKTYLAIVRGGGKSFPESSGTIHNTLSIDSEGRVNVAGPVGMEIKKTGYGQEKRKEAETDWEVLAASNVAPLSLLKLTLHSGIKHQLRIHMARALSAPILGDTLFSSSDLPPAVTRVVSVPTGYMYLHASEVSLFRYSANGKRRRVTVVAPLPGYFTRLCAKLSIPLSQDMVKGGVWVDGDRVGNAGYIGTGDEKKGATSSHVPSPPPPSTSPVP